MEGSPVEFSVFLIEQIVNNFLSVGGFDGGDSELLYDRKKERRPFLVPNPPLRPIFAFFRIICVVDKVDQFLQAGALRVCWIV